MAHLPARSRAASFGAVLLSVAALLWTVGQAHAGPVSIGLNFDGSSLVDSGFIPPDSMGAVGPDHVVELINGRYRVYAKADGALLDDRTLNAFWDDFGQGYAGPYAFDPRVAYDPRAGRWYACSVDNHSQANNVLLAVSRTADPTEGWTGFGIDADSDDDRWADFPRLGFDDQAVYVASKMIGIGSAGAEESVLVVPKADLLAPAPSVASATLLENVIDRTRAYAQPVQVLDASAGSGALLAYSQSMLYRSRVTDPAGTPGLVADGSVFSGGLGFDLPDARQPGDRGLIETNNRLNFSGAVVAVGDFLWAVNNTGAFDSENCVLQWYQVRHSDLTVVQSGALADPDVDYYYPSIAVNADGDVVIGCTASGPDLFASACAFVGATDANGLTTFGEAMILAEGAGAYFVDGGTGRNRWGDYSATVADPTDPKAFWTFQEYASAEDQWTVRVTEIRVPEPHLAAVLAGVAVAALRRRRLPTRAR